MNEAHFPADGSRPWCAGLRRVCQMAILYCAAFIVESPAAWVAGHWEPAWIPTHTEPA